MEKGLKLVLIPSLKEMALRRIAIALYNEPCVLASIAKLQLKPGIIVRKYWGSVMVLDYDKMMYDVSELHWCETVEYKLSQLLFPESLKKELMPILKAIGSEIYKWNSIHEKYLTDLNEYSRVLHVLKRLCWNSAGSVHYRKTAEEFVQWDLIDIEERFELACLYCLEDYIPMLWNELPGESKKIFCRSCVEAPHLELFLPYFILRDQYNLKFQIKANYQNSFEELAMCGNKTFTEFFFHKLTNEDREFFLVETATKVIKVIDTIDNTRDLADYSIEDEKFSDVLRYLLSVMTPEEQLQVLRDLPCEVLRCFLKWPWQYLFLDIADVVWTFLPESKYGDLIFKIFQSIVRKGYHCPDIFQNLFLRSPRKFRKRFVDEAIGTKDFIWFLFRFDDTESIKVILKNIDAVDRVRLVCSDNFLRLIYRRPERWHLLESCLREAVLSKEEKERLKEAFLEFARREGASMERLREEHGKFFGFVEETEIVLKPRKMQRRMLSVE